MFGASAIPGLLRRNRGHVCQHAYDQYGLYSQEASDRYLILGLSGMSISTLHDPSGQVGLFFFDSNTWSLKLRKPRRISDW